MKKPPKNKAQVPKSRSMARILVTAVLLLAIAEMFGSCVFKTKQPAKRSPPPTKTPSPTATLLVPTPTPDPTAGWKTYINQEHKFEVKYPQGWTPETDTSILEEGNLFSVTIAGKTQKPQTEFYDGAQLTIGVPVKTNKDLKTWVKDTYPTESIHGEPNQFSEETIGSLTFQKVYTCGLGCFTYYNVKRGENAYRIITFAAGPDETKHKQTLQLMLSSFKFLE